MQRGNISFGSGLPDGDDDGNDDDGNDDPPRRSPHTPRQCPGHGSYSDQGNPNFDGASLVDRQADRFRQRALHKLFQKYKDGDAKFGGSFTESWPEAFKEFQLAARAFSLNDDLKRETLPLMLKGDADIFY